GGGSVERGGGGGGEEGRGPGPAPRVALQPRRGLPGARLFEASRGRPAPANQPATPAGPDVADPGSLTVRRDQPLRAVLDKRYREHPELSSVSAPDLEQIRVRQEPKPNQRADHCIDDSGITSILLCRHGPGV